MSTKRPIISLIKSQEWTGAIILLFVFILPFLTLAKKEQDIYVNASASGKQDGSKSHPYKTISKALEHADKDTEVHISSGTYKENIKIPKGVEVYGTDRDKVTIDADDDDDPVVEMKDGTKINEVTVKGGYYGIKVGEDDEASIIECIVKNNEKNGIKIEKGTRDKDDPVTISETIVKDNGRVGIYSEKRRVVITNSQILDNGSDGINLEGGVSAWIYKTKSKNNDGSGLKMTLDDSNIWTKYNTIVNNEREGIEVNAYGGAGRIDINKSRIDENERYGIAKVQRKPFPLSVWNGFTVEDTSFQDNHSGSISNVIRLY